MVDLYYYDVAKKQSKAIASNVLSLVNASADGTKLFYFEDSKADITSATITGNHSVALDVENDSAKVTMTECLLGSNSPVKYDVDVIVDEEGTLIMKDCSLGDTIFDDKKMVSGIGSMIGDGSLTNILVILSLAVSAAAIALTVFYNKKRGTKA